MRNSIVLMCGALFLSACGIGYDQTAYVDSGEVNDLLKSPYGTSKFYKDHTIKVLASRDYTVNVLKELARKNNYDMKVEWDRRSISLTYKADKIYKIQVHPGNSTANVNSNILNTIEVYSAITFHGDVWPSEAFKDQLRQAFEAEQKKHDPMKHVDATHIASMKLADVKVRFEAFLRKLYPKGIFESVRINGKSYQVVTVVRSSGNVVTTADYFYYTFKEVAADQTEIQVHTATGSGTSAGDLITNASKEKSQEVLNTIVRKLGL